MSQIEDIIAKWLVTSGHQTGASADADARLEAPVLLAALDAAGFVVAPKEPTDAMLDAAIDEAGWRVEPYTAPRESGVAVDSDMSEADAESINGACKAAMASTYCTMLEARPK